MTATNASSFEDGDVDLHTGPQFKELRRKIEEISHNIELLLKNIDINHIVAKDINTSREKPAARAIDLYSNRRRRAELFGPDLFGEPAWDILLDLFIAAETGKRISVRSACIGAAVPLTTALRWLVMLETRGLILRHSDETDGRRSYVCLSQAGRALMDRYLAGD